jgi:CheY-like chemotaxis protein
MRPDGVPPALLVVDDSAVARAKLRRLFEAGGYRVEVARDGVEALELLDTGFFAVLITDLEMPNMNGLELIAHVQGSLETEDLPIIAITGHDELQARVQDYQSLYGIFKKPWSDRELLKRVEALAQLRGKPGVSLPL